MDESVLDALSDEQAAGVRREMKQEMEGAPPTIGVVGVSGVGKSSTLNALFRTGLPTSPTTACTKEFLLEDLVLEVRRGEGLGLKAELRVIDAPGLGEDLDLDEEYLKAYSRELGRCDVILWVMAARNRAVALDQAYLRKLHAFQGKIVFGVNQVDLVEPVDWEQETNLPSSAQEKNIAAIIEDRTSKLEKVVDKPARVIPFSATRGFNLDELFCFLLEAAPEDRRWIFEGLKGFSYLDFVPDQYRAALDIRNQRP